MVRAEVAARCKLTGFAAIRKVPQRRQPVRPAGRRHAHEHFELARRHPERALNDRAHRISNADVLFISDIYAASEDPIEGVNSETLTAAIKRFGHKDVTYIGPLENAAPILRDHVQPGDLVVTLGAGTVNRVGDQLLALLQERSDTTTA